MDPTLFTGRDAHRLRIPAAPDAGWRAALAEVASADGVAVTDLPVPGVGAFWALHDERLCDRRTGFTPERMLAEHEARFPRPDWVVLWHGYPRLGLDRRDQVALLADGPGGLPALTALIAELRAAGIAVYLPRLPWDRLAGDDGEARFLALAQQVRPDGLFLDTLAGASPALEAAARRHGWLLMPELLPPVVAAAPYALAWSEHRGEGLDVVHRHRWSRSPCGLVLIRRWATDRFDLLAEAWLNAASVLVWEDVFGSWNPWSAVDARHLHGMAAVWRREAALFARGTWTPAAEVGADGLRASSWEHAGRRLWTVVNPGDEPATLRLPGAQALLGASADGDGWRLPARSIAAFATGVDAPIAVQPMTDPAPWHAQPVPVPVPTAPGPDFRPLPAGDHVVASTWARRECGDLRPFHHGERVFGGPPGRAVAQLAQRVRGDGLAIAPRPVTNAEYAAFLAATGWRPAVGDRFLAHWRYGAPPAERRDAPVTWIDLDDARAYAAWRGWRLPTDAEWGLAVERGLIAPDACWEWTESEHVDVVQRWCALVGGDPGHVVRAPDGSDGWFFPGGAGDGARRAKLLRGWPGQDRAGTVGFRCVARAG